VKALALALIAAITICSWIAASNHCAIASIATRAETGQGSCPFHSKPANHSPQSSGAECCKILRAVPTTPTEDLAPAIHDLFPVNNASHQLAVVAPLKISIAPGTTDTGPPGKTSFVELSAILRAHAPPSRP
jgi:hypothetical protein